MKTLKMCGSSFFRSTSTYYPTYGEIDEVNEDSFGERKKLRKPHSLSSFDNFSSESESVDS